jgi:serine/threonine-protein kinase
LFYLAMELVKGRDLGTLLHERGPFSWNELLPIVGQLGATLDYIHQRGLVHRDLKPSNVMVRDSDGQVVLMDFGVVKMERSALGGVRGEVIGSVGYMAPEQIMSRRQVDGRADIYSMGVLVFELLAGERPFKGEPDQVLFGHLQQPPPDLHALAPAVPLNVCWAVTRALAKVPEDRFQSAGEFVEALKKRL